MRRHPMEISATPAMIERLRKSVDGHKYSHGHALVLTGGPGTTGAARLAARGALRVGAGLVTLAVPPAAQLEVASQVTAVMLTRIDDPAALKERLKDTRISALCAGPGLGLDRRAADLVGAVLAARRPTVLDADALTCMAKDPNLVAALHSDCVLTPHAGEFGRLFPDLEPTPQNVRTASTRIGAVVLLKGAETTVAAPDGRFGVHRATGPAAAPWLATAGSGDVLAGIVTGLLAREFDPFDAACTGTFLHARAALMFGPGLIAEDLPETMPRVLRELGV